MAAGKNIIACITLVFFTGIFSSCVHHTGGTASIGQPAPSFKLPDLNGDEISLEELRGKIVLLDFWASWCAPCRMTMPVVEGLSREYENDMVLLAVNMGEAKDSVENYVYNEGISARILLDEKRTVSAVYGIRAIPMNVIIDRSGVVRHVYTGYDPRMASQMRAQIESLR